jgi:hypothetical protein
MDTLRIATAGWTGDWILLRQDSTALQMLAARRKTECCQFDTDSIVHYAKFLCVHVE